MGDATVGGLETVSLVAFVVELVRGFAGSGAVLKRFKGQHKLVLVGVEQDFFSVPIGQFHLQFGHTDGAYVRGRRIGGDEEIHCALTTVHRDYSHHIGLSSVQSFVAVARQIEDAEVYGVVGDQVHSCDGIGAVAAEALHSVKFRGGVGHSAAVGHASH